MCIYSGVRLRGQSPRDGSENTFQFLRPQNSGKFLIWYDPKCHDFEFVSFFSGNFYKYAKILNHQFLRNTFFFLKNDTNPKFGN